MKLSEFIGLVQKKSKSEDPELRFMTEDTGYDGINEGGASCEVYRRRDYEDESFLSGRKMNKGRFLVIEIGLNDGFSSHL